MTVTIVRCVAGAAALALEAMVPMTGATGHGVGVIGQLDFYLDDIFPDTLGRPIFPHGLGIAPGI